MRKLTLLLGITAIFFIQKNVNAQKELFGVGSGGEYQIGIIFKTDSLGQNFHIAHSFQQVSGTSPNIMKPCVASNGLIYGTTETGGLNGGGVLFQYNPSNNEYKELVHFVGSIIGKGCIAGVIEANNGKLYGLTQTGGTSGNGTIFEYDLTTETYVVIHQFVLATGRLPSGRFVQASNGKLYATTTYGGTDVLGNIIELDITTNTVVQKAAFDNTNGKYPIAELVEGDNGKLYGMTNVGGVNAKGVLFEYCIETNELIKKVDFDGTAKGRNPMGGMVKGEENILYGTTYLGGANDKGVFFKFDTGTGVYTKLVDFNTTTIGGAPRGTILKTDPDIYYGLAAWGGTNNAGAIYSFSSTTNTITKEYDLNSTSEGNSPNGTFALLDNILYATTNTGCPLNKGSFFKFNLNDKSLNVCIEFQTKYNGESPLGGLTLANDKFYGITFNGGVNNAGIVYSFNPVTNVFTKICDFNETTIGSKPEAGFLLAKNGKLYATTTKGGVNGGGTIIELDPYTDQVIKRADFTGKRDYSKAAIIQASNGKIYGTTYSSNLTGTGILFEYDIESNIISNLVSFSDDSTGKYPYGGVVQGIDGKLYGMTSSGGAFSNGLVYSYNIESDILKKEFDLNQVNTGKNPYGNFILASDDNLYALMNSGGTFNKGTLVKINFNNWGFEKVFDFEEVPYGYKPDHTLYEASVGKLYGVTNEGGIYYNGTLFEYDFISNTFTKLHDFGTATERNPSTVLTSFCNKPKIKIEASSIEVCQGEEITLTATGADVYFWSDSIQNGSPFVPDLGLNTYYVTGKNACGSMVEEISIKVNPIYHFIQNVIACKGDEYIFPDGASSYIDSIHTSNLITKNGCDSIIVTNLLFSDKYNIEEYVNICEGDYYQFPDGSDTLVTGEHLSVFSSVFGCDSIIKTHLTVLPHYETRIDTTICNGEIYTFPNGNTSIVAKRDTSFLISLNGCDSVIITELHFSGNTYHIDNEVEICQGEIYVFPDGTASDISIENVSVFNSITGCDSVIITNLIVFPEYKIYVDAIICGESYTFPNGNTSNISTVDTSTFVSVNGCDSVIYTSLTVMDNYSILRNIEICQGETYIFPDGTTSDVSDENTSVFEGIMVCDSIIITKLTVNPDYEVFIDTIICEGDNYIFPDGDSSFENITDTSILSTINGCDSTIYTFLTIENIDVQVQQTDSGLLALSESGDYQWVNCQTNEIIQGSSGNFFKAEEDGEYAVIISKNNCTKTSNCYYLSALSTNFENFKNIKIYPNPTTNYLIIEINEKLKPIKNILIYNNSAQLILSNNHQCNGSTYMLKTEKLNNGLYFIKVVFIDQKEMIFKMIKE
ncbi:MAG: hypothetical protein A2X13_04730 [Bacteroidetes bacterium GWC2_33_15]|nr:MAG: hypothetical protein A2X10_06575 [Bacteroidetes bacterium GWA2_33_15]OFX49830.1 MAG: hypothetical protein A2X13_04730 [Bacteroidetes bacterium GWC2_33_15]OFX65021.1 MAG: hypothetical protein A2X15_06650 [Bacteroidetes bacterium GWB2_32_14]OFX69017.1 MAG: hypothetical protein A2X14_13505 [Bacteroidetes bacterium GWD2_33_33]HAN18283.1 hypothetical protein [Bacteroidales bacterium]